MILPVSKDNNTYYNYTIFTDWMILPEIFHLENVEMCYFGKLALDKRQAQNKNKKLNAIKI